MPLLEVNSLTASYGDFQALYGVSMSVDAGQAVAVIGANGAGKSTLLKAIVGMIHASPEMIRFDGEPIGGIRPPKIVARGITMVPEGRRLFSSLTVEENLQVGGQLGRGGPWSLERVFELFPMLAERRDQRSTSLSGGQQQMVAIGRALMSNPSVLLCDEISLGLAPIIVEDIYRMLPRIRGNGTGIIVVEQDIARALRSTDRFYCLQEGRVTLTGRPADASHDAIHSAYFGT